MNFSDDSQERPSVWSRFRGVLGTLLVLLAAPLLAFVLTAFVFQSYVVEGQSMESTLHHQDRLLVYKLPSTLARSRGQTYLPARGDIIVFTQTGLLTDPTKSEQLVKRVVGLPGDKVVIKDSSVTVYNDQNPKGFNPDLSHEWGQLAQSTPGSLEVTVGLGEVFVLGDNRSNSRDSREFGPVSTKHIIGKVTQRIYPFNTFKPM